MDAQCKRAMERKQAALICIKVMFRSVNKEQHALPNRQKLKRALEV